jgi:hypothetical protein
MTADKPGWGLKCPRGQGQGNPPLKHFSILLLFCLVAFYGQVQASEVDGRVRWSFGESNRQDQISRQLFQEYNLSTQDRFPGSNLLRLDFRWDRIVDYDYPKGVDRPSLRATLTGGFYDLTLRYTPTQYTSPSGRLTGTKIQGFLASWRYRHDRLPGLRLEYREDQRIQSPFNFTAFSSASRVRLAEMDHRVGGVTLGASLRRSDNTSTASLNGDRVSQAGTLRMSIDKVVKKDLRLSLGGDFQQTETGIGDAPRSTNRTRNLRASAVWTMADNMQAGVTGFHRDGFSGTGGKFTQRDLNQSFSARAVYRPTPDVDLVVQDDIRRTDNPNMVSSSNLIRLQATYNGLLRKGLRTRLTGMKYVTVRTENTGTPADALDLTLNFNLYRRTEVRTSLAYSRQQHRDDDFLSRHSSSKILEIKSRLTRRVVARFDYRGSQSSGSFDFFEFDNHNYSAHVNYTRSTGFSLSGNVRKAIFVEGERRSQTIFGVNISGRFSEKFTYGLDGTWSHKNPVEPRSRSAGYNARLQYRFSSSAFLTANYQTSGRDGETEGESFGATFQATF